MSIKSLFLIMLIALTSCLTVSAKEKTPKYLDHPYMVEQSGSAREGKLVKVYAFGSNADKAIEQAEKDAVAAVLFSGVRPSAEAAGAGVAMPPMVDERTLNDHLGYFNDFFEKKLKGGEYKYDYQRFVRRVNSEYPTGENNIKTDKGRRVGIYLIVYVDQLRKKLQDDYILKGLNDYFSY